MRPAAVRDNVDFLEFRKGCGRAEELFEVEDGEFTGLPVMRVTADIQAGSGRPGIRDRNTSPPKEMPKLTDNEGP